MKLRNKTFLDLTVKDGLVIYFGVGTTLVFIKAGCQFATPRIIRYSKKQEAKRKQK